MAVGIAPSPAIVDQTSRWAQVGGVSYCRVNAGGVPADWVEAAIATTQQLTLVCFLGSSDPVVSVDMSRWLAGQLAIATGARVLTVGCRNGPEHSSSAAVEDGLVAYRWLLGEGCDLGMTAFIDDIAGGSLGNAVLRTARALGLPLPRRTARATT